MCINAVGNNTLLNIHVTPCLVLCVCTYQCALISALIILCVHVIVQSLIFYIMSLSDYVSPNSLVLQQLNVEWK